MPNQHKSPPGYARLRRLATAVGLIVFLVIAGALATSAPDAVVAQDPVTESIEVRVAASSDDAEEAPGGGMSLTSSDLELVFDGGDQTVGMRFNGVNIPQGAPIVNAYLQFQVDETGSIETPLVIGGQDADDAATFTSVDGNISSRPQTAATVAWSPAPWLLKGEAGPDQRSPDITSVIQEIVDRPGWVSGNSLAIVVTGTGERGAEAYDGEPAGAPLLHVEYVAGQPPAATIGTPPDGATFTTADPITFSGSATDPEDGDVTDSLSWASNIDGLLGSGGTFSHPGLSAGVHSVTATATDSGGWSGSDQITITVTTPGGNLPPVVSAGPDLAIGLFEDALLDGTVSDDGLPDPPAVVTTTWQQVSGPGSVTFADAAAVDTTASFSAAGAYLLELTAEDGELAASDQLSVTVFAASIIRVPEDQPTIQAGIDAAQDGDMVLVSPGTYFENPILANKSIILASQFYTTRDPSFVDQTIVDGGGLTVFTVDSSAGPETKIIGLTIQNGNDGISARAKLDILDNYFTGNQDAIDYGGSGGGVLRNNVFDNNLDDAVDLDGSSEAVIENNIIRNSHDDGIEIRLYDYTGPTLNIIIRGNLIYGSGEDGIQLIDYYALSNRYFLIERNVIEASAMAGLGLMDNATSTEDYRAANILEPIHLFNNIFIGNDYALSGGDNLIALNNLFVDSTTMAVKGMDGGSIAAYNLFWNNGIDYQTSNVDLATTLFADPFLDADHHLLPGSPAIDAGTAYFEWQGQTVLDLPPTAYYSSAPDVGRFESDLDAANTPPTAIIDAPANGAAIDAGEVITFSGSASDAEDGDLTSVLSWVSSLDGAIGTGGSFTRSDLSTGDHTISATATDSGGLTALDQISITVNLTSTPPNVWIGTPESGATFNLGEVITFSGGANDGQDGNLTAGLSWLSSLDGALGSGGSFTRSDLSAGVHTITATVTDSDGLTGLDIAEISVFSDTGVLVGAGDIAQCSNVEDEETAKLLDKIPGIVFTTGDNVYQDGTAAEFDNCYDPTWGRHKVRTRPSAGNHEYHTPGATGYYDYFGTAAGEAGTGYYSYDAGEWHIVVLNSNCTEVGGCDSASAQGQWLQADLAANPNACTLAYWHEPLFSSGTVHGGDSGMLDFWQLLYDAGADVVLNGHEHNYERFALQDPNGVADPERGIRQFTVGTGGAGLYALDAIQPNSEARNSVAHGVLKLTLHPTSYDWEFVPIAGQTFTDTGSAPCVTPGNTPPLATDDSANTPEDTAVTINVAANDSDPEASLVLTSTNTACATCLEPSNGSLVNNGDGSFGYTPNADYNGSDSFVYEVCDSGAPVLCDTATVLITVDPVDDPPLANDDSANTMENTAVTVDVAANDSDVDGDLAATSANSTCANGSIGCAGAANGSLTDLGNGTITYNPDLGFSGSDSFVYEICDVAALCDTAVVNITVGPFDDPPLAPVLVSPADAATGVSTSTSLEVTVSDPEGSDLTVTFYGRPAAPTADSDFTLIALPDTQHYVDDPANYANFGAQTQWVVENRAALNIPFVTHLGDVVENGNNNGDPTEWLVADAAMGLLEDPATTLLADGIPFGLAVGNHDIHGGGTSRTQFFNEFFGVSRFQDRAYYGGHYGETNDNSFELFSASGMDFIILHFDYANDPDPLVLDWADNLLKTYSDRRAIAVAHKMLETGNPGPFSTQGQAIYDALKDNPNLFLMLGGHHSGEGQREDTFEGNTVYSLLSDYQGRPNGGDGWLRMMEFSPANSEIRVKTYTPVHDQFETDTDSQFTLFYDMGTVNFQVLGTNTNVPSGSNTNINWAGLDNNIEYEWYVTVDDGNSITTGPAWSFTTGGAVNTPPLATDDTGTVAEGGTWVEPAPGVLSNDIDPENDTLAVTTTPVTTPTNGTVTLGADGSYSYTHDGSETASDSFVYTACDPGGLCDTATVTLTITAINDPPLAVDDTGTVAEGGTLVEPAPGVLDNDSDPEGDPLTVTVTPVTTPTNGTLTLGASGSYSYTHDGGETASDNFVYEVCDDLGACSTATVTLTVNAVNDAPLAGDDAYSTDEDTLLNEALPGVLGNDSDADGDGLSAILVGDVSSGTLALNADGSFTYTPTADYHGMDSFTYRANDGSADSDPATVTITVSAVNDAPLAGDDAYSTNEDTPLVEAAPGILGNDSDVDLDGLSAILASDVSSGTLALNADGSFTYTPTAHYHGTDSFTYRAHDGIADSNLVTVTLTVTAVNDLPLAGDDAYSTDEDTPLNVVPPGVLGNDSDADGDGLSAILVSDVSSGTLALKADGSFTYTPTADYYGTDSFTYRAHDGIADSNLVTVTLTVTAVNDLPLAGDDAYSTDEDTPLVEAGPGVLGNDSDADGDGLSAILVSDVSSGTLALSADGSFTYTPTADYHGADSFSYVANDGSVDSNVATVAITVTAINDPPLASDDTAITQEDTLVTIDVAANDSDLDGSLVLTSTNTACAGCAEPAHGSLLNNGDGTFVYTPTTNYTGGDSFVYEICDSGTPVLCDTAAVSITVTITNDPPLATDDSATTDEDTAVIIDVAANDSDLDGNLDVTSANSTCANGSDGCAGAGKGLLADNGDGTITYTPSLDSNGSDSFVYEICDDLGLCATATAAITVTAVDDPPVANGDSATTNEDTAVTIDVAANDTDVDLDLVLSSTTVITAASNGGVSNNGDGTFEYAPDPDHNGSDSFGYEICDSASLCDTATVTMTITAVNDEPVATGDTGGVAEGGTLVEAAPGVLGNDSDVENDTLTVTTTPVATPTNGTLTLYASGSYSYTHDGSETASDSFVYQVCDTGPLCDTAAVTLTITPVNDAPQAVDDTGSVAEGGTLVVPALGVLTNDSDAENDPLTVSTTLVATPTNGTVTLTADGSYTYTHDGSETASDSFVYKVCDTGSQCSTATVNLTITPVNDPPQAVDDTGTVAEGGTLNEAAPGVLLNDSDPDNATLIVTATPATTLTNGTVTVNADGSYTYTHDGSETTGDSFVYEVCDAGLLCDSATVTLTITPVNDPPLAVDDAGTVDEGSTLIVPAPGLLSNDGDPEADPLVVPTTPVTTPTHGTLTLAASGSYTYTHDGSETTDDSFVYEVCDAGLLCDTATVTLAITPVNDLPVANDDSATTSQGTVVIIDVVANDTDVDGNLVLSSTTTVCAACSGPLNGSLVNEGDGTFQYTPEAGFVGDDSFVYQICDSEFACDTASVSVTISAVVPTIFEVRVAASSDDAEEQASGRVALNSGDLQLVFDKDPQVVGLRFISVTIPPGASILDAYIQFEVDEATSESTTLTLQGQAEANPLTFVNVNTDISSRPRTAGVEWTPVPWTTIGEAGPDQRATGLAPVIQGIVDLAGWSSGNSLVIIITSTGTGTRVAESYNGDQAGAPLLHVEYVVLSPNDPPVAGDDAYSTDEDMPLSVVAPSILDNDSDTDGDSLSAVLVSDVSNGSLTLSADGSFSYTPDADYSGPDSFTYKANDGVADSNVATVSIIVNALNDPPLAVDDSATTSQNITVTIDVAANDSDVDGNLDPSSTLVITGALNGTTINNGDGTVQYEPNAAFTGGDSFAYQICDSGSPILCGTATVSITVTVANDPPVANDDTASTDEDTPLTINVAANDTDTNGNLVPGSANTACPTCSDPTNGSLQNNGDGTFDYAPSLDYDGPDSFVYEICDTLGACDTATVSITVVAVNDPPLAVDDSVTTSQGITVTVDVAANDSDVDLNLDLSSASVITGPLTGTVTSNGDGSFDYTPDAGFSGTDSFVYEICDTGAPVLCDTATVNLTITTATTTVNFAPSDDAMVSSKKPTANYGAATTLELRNQSQETITSYLKFNITGVTGTIQSAKLRLYADKGTSDGGSIYLTSNDYRPPEPGGWVEGGLTWENAPSLDGGALSTAGVVVADAWVEFDVSTAILGDGVYSFGLSTLSSNRAVYRSKEAVDNHPVLILEIGSNP